MILDEAVAEVFGLLTGLDLTYDPELDRYRTVVRSLNRALRDNSLEQEWAHYADLRNMGPGMCGRGASTFTLSPGIRPRINGDDSVRLVDCDGNVMVWAYFLPRDALHKYRNLPGLWISATGSSMQFSRPLTRQESELDMVVPVMREPRMFRLPPIGEAVPARIRNQPLDFNHPDLVVARAAHKYAQADPVMQPRVPTLEQEYKNLMYQLMERDSNHTDTPFQNEFDLGLQNGIVQTTSGPPLPQAGWI